MSQHWPPEKPYTPPVEVPGQHAQYPEKKTPQKHDLNQTPAPQPQYPTGQYGQGPTQYAAQPYPPQGQHSPGQYPTQPPPQAVPAAYPAPAQFQHQPYTQQQQPHPAQPSGPAIMQQPLPVIGMSIAIPGGNRNVMNLPRDMLGRRAWTFGLCDCFNAFSPCLLGCFCPCILYAQLKRRVDYLNTYASPDPVQGGTGIDPNCMIWSAVHFTTGCGFILQAANRSHIRNRYMIAGTGVEDFFTACWCTPCQLTQEYRELELEEKALTAVHR